MDRSITNVVRSNAMCERLWYSSVWSDLWKFRMATRSNLSFVSLIGKFQFIDWQSQYVCSWPIGSSRMPKYLNQNKVREAIHALPVWLKQSELILKKKSNNWNFIFRVRFSLKNVQKKLEEHCPMIRIFLLLIFSFISWMKHTFEFLFTMVFVLSSDQITSISSSDIIHIQIQIEKYLF